MVRDQIVTEAIRSLKEKIKKLAEEQTRLKKLRKQFGGGKPLPEEFLQEFHIGRWHSIEALVHTRKTKITALLNLYLAVRGKAFRHGIRDKWGYRSELKNLAKEFSCLDENVQVLLMAVEDKKEVGPALTPACRALPQ